MRPRLIPILLIGLTLSGCGWLSPVSPPEVVPLPLTQSAAASQALAASSLTADQVKNAKYSLVNREGHPTVQLANGSYQTPTDPASPNFMSIVLAPQMAFGDLNGDGLGDAAVLLTENYGGTGVFVSVVAIIDQGGQPVQAAAEMIDDRPVIHALSIQNGEILVDATVHGPNDPGCCATQPTQRSFRFENGRLIMTRFSSQTPDGGQRSITIDAPSAGAQASWPVTVAGKVTIAPFENTLGYSVYDALGSQVTTGSLSVEASQPGSPGSFSFPLDLSKTGLNGPVRIEIVDVSPADGSILAQASVELTVK